MVRIRVYRQRTVTNKIAILLLGFLVSPAVLGQQQQLSLKDFLTVIRTTHPLMKQEALAVDVQKARRYSILGQTDVRLTADASVSHSEPIQTSPFTPTSVDIYELQGKARRNFWYTGGELSFGLTSRYTGQQIADISLPGTPGETIQTGIDRLYEQSISLTYNQPLLENAGGAVERTEYEALEYVVDATELTAIENQESFLFDLGTRYIDWVLLTEKELIAEERLELSGDELELVQERREANLVDEVDVLRAEDQVRIARQELLLIQSELKALSAALNILAQGIDFSRLKPAFKLYDTASLPASEQAYEDYRNRSRTLAALEFQRQELLRRKTGDRESARPSLDLNLGLGLRSGDPRFGNSFDMNRADYTLGLSFSHPLGNRSAEGRLLQTALQLEQLTYHTGRVSLDLNAQITALTVRIGELVRILELNQQQIESAKRRTEAELGLYEQGRSELTFVIQAQDNEEAARFRYAENAANYQKLLLEYMALTDQLLTPENSEG